MNTMVMYIILMTVFLSACLASTVDDPAWREYKLKFGKTYTEEEEASRYEIWSENVKEILMHNAENSTGYEQGVNQFTDMTVEEFKQKMGGCFKLPEQYLNGSATPEGEVLAPPSPNVKLPSFVDWRRHGFVTGVKDQGQCGSCYSFSATGALEGQWFRKTGKLPSLSEQQIIDCSAQFGNHGCNGGWPVGTFLYFRYAGGSESESSYPYEVKQGKCRFNSKYVAATCRGLGLWFYNENILKFAVAMIGPISVAIDASHNSFQRYKSGVYYEPKCGQEFKDLDHAVLVVGYGTENGLDYWLVKNSWGTNYGESGYIKMRRNFNNMCGIASMPSYPIV